MVLYELVYNSYLHVCVHFISYFIDVNLFLQ